MWQIRLSVMIKEMVFKKMTSTRIKIFKITKKKLFNQIQSNKAMNKNKSKNINSTKNNKKIKKNQMNKKNKKNK